MDGQVFGGSPLKLHHTWWRDTTPVPHHFCHLNCHLIRTPHGTPHRTSHRTTHHSITQLGRKIRNPLWKSDFSSLLLSTTTLSSTTCTSPIAYPSLSFFPSVHSSDHSPPSNTLAILLRPFTPKFSYKQRASQHNQNQIQHKENIIPYFHSFGNHHTTKVISFHSLILQDFQDFKEEEKSLHHHQPAISFVHHHHHLGSHGFDFLLSRIQGFVASSSSCFHMV